MKPELGVSNTVSNCVILDRVMYRCESLKGARLVLIVCVGCNNPERSSILEETKQEA